MKYFIEKAEQMITTYLIQEEGVSEAYEIFTVWSCFAAGNAKALLSTTLPNGLYFEVTYIDAEKKIVLDVYKKKHHTTAFFDIGISKEERMK